MTKPNKATESVVIEDFQKTVKALDEKFGDGYAAKNPNLVTFLMGSIERERDREERLNYHN